MNVNGCPDRRFVPPSQPLEVCMACPFRLRPVLTIFSFTVTPTVQQRRNLVNRYLIQTSIPPQ